MTTPFLRNCRAAVALNNMGVTLLERRHFRDATKNFMDGLKLMKGGTPDEHERESLRRSARCVASSDSSTRSSPAYFHLTVLTYDDSPMCAMTAALHEYQSSGSGSVFRLDWNDDEDDKANTEVYYMATMFHNYSVACRMQSLDCKSKSKAQTLQTLATKSANAARSTLVGNDVNRERSLTLLMLNVQHLMQLAAAEGDKDMACMFYCEIASLRSRLEDCLAEIDHVAPRGRTAASAA